MPAISRVLALLILVSGVTAWGEPGELFFHWGDVDGNRTLLRLGGYAADNHQDGLGQTGHAVINESVLQKAREWYDNAKRRDVAGAGFYMSPDLFNSRAFGNDLLIVELVTADGKPFTPNVDSNIRTRADAALDAGNFGILPLVTRYNESAGWHVVSRTASQTDGVELRFRPPTAADVPRIWAKLTEGKGATDVLNRLVQLAEHTSGQNRGTQTATGRIVFDRLLFDHGSEWLSKQLPERLLAVNANGEVQGGESLFKIFNAYREVIPNDGRTSGLFQQIYRQLREASSAPNAPKLKSAELFRLVAEYVPRFPEADRAEAALWALRSFDPAMVRADMRSMLGLMAPSWEKFTPDIKQELRKMIVDPAARIARAEDYPDVHRDLARLMGRARADSVLRNDYVAHFKRLTDNPWGNREPVIKALNARTHALSTMLASDPSLNFDDVIRDHVLPSFSVHTRLPDQAHLPNIAFDLLDKAKDPALQAQLKQKLIELVDLRAERVRRAREMPRYDPFSDPAVVAKVRRLVVQRGALTEAATDGKDAGDIYHAVTDPALREEIHKIVKRAQNAHRTPPELGWGVNPFKDYLEALLKQPGMDVHTFERRAQWLIRSFPERALAVVEAFEEAPNYALTNLVVDWARLAEQARAQVPRNTVHEKLIDEAYSTARQLYERNHLPVPSRDEFARVIRRMLTVIPESHEYSDLSRTFLLVDPLYVSEDLRVMNASRPFQRFNEHLRRDGQDTSQPAWENHVQAWAEMAKIVFLREPARNNSWMFVSGLNDVHRTLMRTYVDGQPVDDRFGSSNWDRSKYTTFFSDDDWALFGGDSARRELERFFAITKVDGGYQLKFHDQTGIDAHVPGTLRYNQARAMLAHRIETFVFMDAARLKDPVQRAARILYLLPKLHPHENGNGRLARLWAAAELVRAGYPVPVGLPTNDFLMSQRHMELEVRKAVKLGEMWQNMLVAAQRDGISAERFFQERFRGSALEGLMHVSPTDTRELAAYVDWLYRQTEPPAWGRDFAREIEGLMGSLRAQHGTLARASEAERARALHQAWQSFRARMQAAGTQGLPPSVGMEPRAVLAECRSILGRIPNH